MSGRRSLSFSQDIVFCVQDGPVVWRRLMLGPFTATTDQPYSAHPTQGLVFVFVFVFHYNATGAPEVLRLRTTFYYWCPLFYLKNSTS